jgi:hypothetical protein
MADKIPEFMNRMGKNSKGLGAGGSALLVAAGLLYAGSQSIFTGTIFIFLIKIILLNDFILFQFQLRVVIVLLYSIELVVFHQIQFILKVYTFAFRGFNIQLFMISVQSQDLLKHQLVAKVSKL